MQHIQNQHRWAVILAGGEGLRLRPLTRFVAGDDRPKQFCTFTGGRSLLAHARQRINRSISVERTLFSLLSAHKKFYDGELEDVPSARMIVQPANRGTLPAILYSLCRVIQLDPQAVIAFFPSDHYYSDEHNFLAGVELAFNAAEGHPEPVVLLGAPATYPATDYGWIEAEAARSANAGFLRVKRFWEKPSRAVAESLFDRGCVWNTFVMVGRAGAFLDLIRSSARAAYKAFRPLWTEPRIEDEARIVHEIYAHIPPADLSRSVLSAVPERLGIFCLGEVGWSDLGDPERLLEVLSRIGQDDDWLAAWRRRPMRADTNALNEFGSSSAAVSA